MIVIFGSLPKFFGPISTTNHTHWASFVCVKHVDCELSACKKNFPPTRHKSGDMTDESGRNFKKNDQSVISPLSKHQH